MVRKTRLFCLTMAIFFLISCFTAVSCYASTENVTPEAQGGSGNITNESTDAGQNDEDSDTLQDQETDSAVNENDSANEDDNTSIDIEDKTSQSDETEDQSGQDNTNQDKTNQDETTIDQTTNDNTATDEITDDETTDDETTKDKTTTNTNKDTNTTKKPTPKPKPVNTESLWYISKISMKKEHQKVLWDYCNSRKIDYIDMLALIYTESNFNEKANGKYKGYFQFSTGTCARMAKSLKTPNTPLDGKININWGTALYSSILKDNRVKNLTGKKRRDVALSIFQRGTEGYDRYGISTRYLKTYYKKWNIIRSYLKKS
ncbi:MAG TPA: hypothetical protein VHT34_12115 [Clostridia bacterium]|nr:hypothetical protein [Clostridia bacterium]